MVDPKLREMVAAFSSGDVFKKEDSILDGYLAQIIDRDQNALYLVDNQLRPEVVPAMVGVILSIKQSRMEAILTGSGLTFYLDGSRSSG